MPSQTDWVAGNEFSVTIDGVEYPFKTVDLDLSSKDINRSNSKYQPGYMVRKSGNHDLSVELVGPYKIGEVPIVTGGEYTWRYKPHGAHVGFEFVGLVLNVKHSNDTEDAPNMSLSVKSQSLFTLVIE